MHHCSTAQQRVEWISQMIASSSEYGLVSEVSRRHQVWRQTLYRWKAKGEQALQNALGAVPRPAAASGQVEEQVLTLLIEGHASYRGIQTCLRRLCGVSVSLGSITDLVQRAGQRASEWVARQGASTPRALALDEQYSSQRGKCWKDHKFATPDA